MTELRGEEADEARRLARMPLDMGSIRHLHAEGIRVFEVRIADFYAGPEREVYESEVAWRDRWTAAYNSACWAADTKHTLESSA